MSWPRSFHVATDEGIYKNHMSHSRGTQYFSAKGPSLFPFSLHFSSSSSFVLLDAVSLSDNVILLCRKILKFGILDIHDFFIIKRDEDIILSLTMPFENNCCKNRRREEIFDFSLLTHFSLNVFYLIEDRIQPFVFHGWREEQTLFIQTINKCLPSKHFSLHLFGGIVTS